jgi:hypothetical protein
MKAHEALIAWTPTYLDDEPTIGQVKVGLLMMADEAHRDWTAPYACTGGAAYLAVRDLRGKASIIRLLVEFIEIVVADGIDPRVAHREFLKVDEYAALFGDLQW